MAAGGSAARVVKLNRAGGGAAAADDANAFSGEEDVLDQHAEDDPDAEGVFVDELKPGTRLLHGQYTILRYLNSGGFGITYLAKDSLDRTVVIKECFPGAFCRRSETIVRARSRAFQDDFRSIVRLFVQEARNLSKLVHPHIVGVHQVFEDNDTAYMAIDYVDGRDMLDILEDPQSALSPDQIVTWLKKMLGAVGFIHESGVLHRDISPDNILIDDRGNPVLIDFGAAREQAAKQSRALSALRVVKDGYSPQEFYIAGSIQTASSDLYALAATFYHAIAGAPPPNSQRRLAGIAEESGDPYIPLAGRFEGYPEGFLEAIDRAASVLPKDRIASAADWLKMIDPGAEVPAAEARDIENAVSRILRADEAAASTHAAQRMDAVAPRSRTGGVLVVAAVTVVALLGAAFLLSPAGEAPGSSGAGATMAESEAEGTAPVVAVDSAAAALPLPAPRSGSTRQETDPAPTPAPMVASLPAPVAEGGAAPAIAATPDAEPAPAVPEASDPVQDAGPGVAVALPEPAPAVDEPVGPNPDPAVLDEQIAAMRWERALPFETVPIRIGTDSFPAVDSFDPVVAALPGNEWLAQGVRIYAVNDEWVSDQAGIVAVIEALPEPAPGEDLVPHMRVRPDDTGPFQQVALSIPGVGTVELSNGTVFRIEREPKGWSTVVVTADESAQNGLRPGDVVIAESITGETLSAADSLERIVDRLARERLPVARFEVVRDGATEAAEMELARAD